MLKFAGKWMERMILNRIFSFHIYFSALLSPRQENQVFLAGFHHHSKETSKLFSWSSEKLYQAWLPQVFEQQQK